MPSLMQTMCHMPICGTTGTAAATPTRAGRGGGYDGVGGVMGVQTVKGSGLGRMPSAQLVADTTRYIRGTTSIEGRSPKSRTRFGHWRRSRGPRSQDL